MHFHMLFCVWARACLEQMLLCAAGINELSHNESLIICERQAFQTKDVACLVGLSRQAAVDVCTMAKTIIFYRCYQYSAPTQVKAT